jgi:hypothetical protein
MNISATHVSAVIKTYLKNTKAKIENRGTLPANRDVKDAVAVSENARKMLYERIGKKVLERLKHETG